MTQLPATAAVDLLVEHIGQLCTLDAPAVAPGPRRGGDLDDVGAINDAALAVSDGKIIAAGPREEVLAAVVTGPGTETVDAGGRAVIPGFVDPHTHAVFGRTRQDEYERRLRGESYLEIAAAGGGIQASVQDLRARSEEQLVEATVPRLREMLAHGTTTVEIKSGYGLSHEDEMKMLRAARRAADEVGLDAVLTCLAAHEMPPEYADRRDEYIDLICGTILPQVAAGGLADRCDVFCEPTVYDLAETETILTAAKSLGLQTTVHADELAAYGGGELAARLGASSADHLIRIDAAGIDALAVSQTVATLLPGTVFTLGIRDYAPARKLIEAGAAIALASDFNPGSCPILSVPLVMAIACTQMRLSPAEALCAVTVNSAWALGRGVDRGVLAAGRRADFLLLDVDDYRLIPYHAGHNPVAGVWLCGRSGAV